MSKKGFIEVPRVLIERISVEGEELNDSVSVFDVVRAVNKLSNSISDLRTWHPNHNERTGSIDVGDEL